LKTDGTLWTWGYNGNGQLGDGTTTDSTIPLQIGSGYASVAAGFFHTVALKTDGTLWVWGYNGYGQLGDGTTIDKTSPVQIGFSNFPQGLSFNASSGILSGIPTIAATGTYNVIITAANPSGSASRTFLLTVSMPPLPTFSSVPAITATVGKYFGYWPGSNHSSTRYSITGTIPPGLNFDTYSGNLSGTPTTAGTYENIVISATNITGTTKLPAFSITVIDVNAQVGVVSSSFLPNRGTRQYTGTLTIANNGAALIGKINIAFSSLSPGVQPTNLDGLYQGLPYLTVANNGLAAGAKMTIPLQFSNPNNVKIFFNTFTYQE
jgi:hypothetical protein